jgi:hypothetical protein
MNLIWCRNVPHSRPLSEGSRDTQHRPRLRHTGRQLPIVGMVGRTRTLYSPTDFFIWFGRHRSMPLRACENSETVGIMTNFFTYSRVSRCQPKIVQEKKSTVWYLVFFDGIQRYGVPATSLAATHFIIIINFRLGKHECYLLFLCQQQYQNKPLLVQRQALFKITCCQGEKVHCF